MARLHDKISNCESTGGDCQHSRAPAAVPRREQHCEENSDERKAVAQPWVEQQANQNGRSDSGERNAISRKAAAWSHVNACLHQVKLLTVTKTDNDALKPGRHCATPILGTPGYCTAKGNRTMNSAPLLRPSLRTWTVPP